MCWKVFIKVKETMMKWIRWTAWMFPVMLVALAVVAGGCNKGEDKTASAKDEATGDGWWCVEHGMPEAECAQCNPKLAAKLKKEGDWCKEHNRPESQCVICHPELREKYAAEYRAKYGKEPPPIKEESTDDDAKKGRK
jgi:hypothetical protein